MSNYQVPDFHRLTPAEELEGRGQRLRNRLVKSELDAALIVQPVDRYYLTGTMQAGHLLLPIENDPLLMVRRDFDRARAESAVGDVIPLRSLKGLPGLVKERLGRSPRRLGLEMDILPVNLFQIYQSLWPQTEFVDVSPAILDCRAIKSPYEIRCMQRTGDLARSIYSRIPQLLRPGLTEIDLAGLITSEAFRVGHQNHLRMRAFDQEMYTWHVISGASGGISGSIDAPFSGYGLSPAFPMGASLRKIAEAEPLLIDFGVCLDGYQVDLTRMFSLGSPPGLVRDAFEALRVIEAELLHALRPGARCGDLFEKAMRTADRLGFGQSFMGPSERKTTFVGHGVGLEINEWPILARGSNAFLQAGMTVALELKMVLPGIGAVGLENTVLVQDIEPEKLSKVEESFVMVETDHRSGA